MADPRPRPDLSGTGVRGSERHRHGWLSRCSDHRPRVAEGNGAGRPTSHASGRMRPRTACGALRCPAPSGCLWRLARQARRWQLDGMTRYPDLGRALAEFCDRSTGRRPACFRAGQVPSDNPPGDCAPHAQRAAALLEDLGRRAAGAGARAPGAGERHDQRNQSDRARARPGTDDRVAPMATWCRRARLVHPSLWRRDPGRLDVWPRRGGVEAISPLCLRPARG